MRWHFDLSRNKSLRTLETTAESMVSPGAGPSFLSIVLSTIASPPPLNIVIVYQHYDVGYMFAWWSKPVPLMRFPSKGMATVASYHQRRFKELREMYMVREFRLVLCVDVLDGITEYTMRALEGAVATEKAKGMFDYLLCEPLIISEIRSPRAGPYDKLAGWTSRYGICSSAL